MILTTYLLNSTWNSYCYLWEIEMVFEQISRLMVVSRQAKEKVPRDERVGVFYAQEQMKFNKLN